MNIIQVLKTFGYDTIDAYERCATGLFYSKRCYSFEDVISHGQFVSWQRHSRAPYRIKCCHYYSN